jgi:hypothetical protein
MSARLTLLFLCDQSEAHSVFLSALLAADFHVLIGHNIKEAKSLLYSVAVDAILVSPEAIRDDRPIGTELKLAAPATPVILCHDGSLAAQPGFDSLCSADLQDETVMRAVAFFFHRTLTASRQPRLNAGTKVRVLRAPQNSQIAV